MKKNIAYIFLNGDLLGSTNFYKNFINNNIGDFYCADGGYKHCKALNIFPLEIWGDLDSISDVDIKFLEQKNIIIKKFNKDKDFTDGELILNYVYEKGYDQIIIIGGMGGRFSHTLTNLSLIVKYQNAIFLTESEKIFLVKKSHILENKFGTTISFIPYSSNIISLTLNGFKYPLSCRDIELGSSICMSNIIISNSATITYSKGWLIGIIENFIDNL